MGGGEGMGEGIGGRDGVLRPGAGPAVAGLRVPSPQAIIPPLPPPPPWRPSHQAHTCAPKAPTPTPTSSKDMCSVIRASAVKRPAGSFLVVANGAYHRRINIAIPLPLRHTVCTTVSVHDLFLTRAPSPGAVSLPLPCPGRDRCLLGARRQPHRLAHLDGLRAVTVLPLTTGDTQM